MHNYRIFLFVVFVLGYSSSLQAKSSHKLNINDVTVFLKGAQLTSTTKVSLTQGENEILFTNVAGHINIPSMTISAGKGVSVESATFQNNYLVSEVLSPRAKEIKDSIELITSKKDRLENKIAVLAEQITVLQSNRAVRGDNNGLSVAELSKLLDLINNKMEGYLNEKDSQTKLKKEANELLAKLNRQLKEEQQKGFQPGGQILVVFHAKQAITTPVTISYTTPNAGWTPEYDIRVESINQPANLFYKANVHQNCGVNWDKVHVTLSTGNPQESAQAPVLYPWHLGFYTRRGKGLSFGGSRLAGGAVTESIPLKMGAEENYGGASMDDYVHVDNGGISTTFDIDLPYSVPNDGKQHVVAIKKYDIPATYRYYAAPKLDCDAFLQAQITEWEDLNLLPGKTSIFYEGTYVGQGQINTHNTTDTLTFSLGRDKKIVITRERDKKRRKVRTIGSNVRETFAYTIKVRNTRKEPINLILQDQVPVSEDKDIVVEDIETDKAEQNELTGILEWRMNLKANETNSVTLGYTIKYPKGKQINGLR